MTVVLTRAIAGLALLFCAATAAAALPKGVVAGPAAEGISEYRLANGLRVLLYPDASKPTVTLNITYFVGSRDENYGETGMAHLLEHLVFKGSRRIPAPVKEFGRRGFSYNGTTSFDRTNYYATFKADDANLRWMIGWTADSMVNSFIARKDLDTEMSVVRNEYEIGENRPASVLFKRMMSVAYDWHNYSNAPIGNRSDIENVPIANLQRFYRTYYQPDNAMLIVSGRFDAAKALGWIAASYAAIPRPARPLPKAWTAEPVQDGERSFAVRRKGETSIVMAGYKIPSASHPDTLALNVAVDVLGTATTGRLHRELVEKGLATRVSKTFLLTREPGMVMFVAEVKPGDSVDKARDRLVEVVEGSFAAAAPTAEEMQRVRRSNETEFEQMFADPESLSGMLSEFAGQGDWRLLFLVREGLEGVDAAAAASTAQRYFRRDNRTVGVFLPEASPRRAEVPAAAALEERLRAVKARPATAQGEAFDASPANIEARTRRTAVGDLKLALLPKKTRGETVDVSLRFRFGDDASLSGRQVVADLAGRMLERGTSKFTRQQLADEMTRLKMTGGLSVFRTTRANLPEALRLVAHVLREASFPATEFEQLRSEMTAELKTAMNNPGALARDAVQAHSNSYPPGDRRAYLPYSMRLAAVQKASVDEAKAFHAAFWGTSRGEIAVVGDFEAAAVEPLLRDLFGGWRSPAPYAPEVREFRPVAPTRIVIDVPERDAAALSARIALDLADGDPDYAPLVVANAIFGGGMLSNRLIDRVRQKEGLSYYAGSGLGANHRDRAGRWSASGSFAPQNAARFEAALKEELARFLKDGVSAKEVSDAVNGLLQERAIDRAQDNVLAIELSELLDAGRDFHYVQALEARMRKLTPAEVVAAARRHLDPAKMVIVVAGDAKKGVK